MRVKVRVRNVTKYVYVADRTEPVETGSTKTIKTSKRKAKKEEK